MNSRWKWLAAVGLVISLAHPAAAQDTPADPYAAVMKRDFGTAIDEMTAIEKDIEAAAPAQYPAFEDHLIAILTAADATKPGKQFACQMLRIVGSPKCIPAVAALLPDEQLSHIARYVLLPMHVPAADAALHAALAQTQGAVRIGIVNSLGDRRDAGALSPIAALVNDPDELTGRAALNAIGKIGGVRAMTTLDHVKPPAPLAGAWALAYLHVAENMAASGDKVHQSKMFRKLFAPEYPEAVRAAALSGFAVDQREKAAPLIVQNFSAAEPIMRRAAATAVIAVPGHPATLALARQLATVPADVKPALIAALATRGDAAGVTDSLNRLTSDADPAVRKAAILALGRLGNASSVPVLTALLQDSAARRDATQALAEIHGPGVTEALLASADRGEPAARSAVLAILAQRGQAEALPAFRKALADPDRQVRGAGIAGLSAWGTLEDMKPLADRILAPSDDGEREEAGAAVSAIGLRVGDENARSAPVLQALAGAPPEAKVQLIAVLSSLGGDRAFQTVQAAMAESGDVHKAAIRGLAEWPNSTPMAVLRTAAKEDTDKSSRIVALRGYIRMVAASGRSPEERAQAYKDAIGMAERPDEKRQSLAGLAEIGTADSLAIVQPLLDDPDVKTEAYFAYERIGEALAAKQPDAARDALKRVSDNAPNDRLKNRAKAALDRIR
ncbi:MAG TPA: HEAT repeat domain-containing protein [Chthonomonadaceae bacterium]|nr:HEAT repeat domain-containing protein [Chthonomonadaceae bacterium]